jgi:HlyD family secretion protein
MKKKLIIIGVVIILVAVVIFVAVAKMRGRSEKKTDRIEVVRRGPFVVKLNERGNLEPLIKVDVRSNVEGEIEKLYVDEGYDVVKGQKLLKIDEKQIREEYNQSQANYNAAEAEMDRAMENITLSSGRLESNIQLGESTNAKAELDRKEELHRKKFVSLQEVENARLAYSSAQSQYESAQNDVQAQEKDVQSREKSIESREMRIQAEKSDLENLKESLNKEEDQVEIQIQQAQERLDLLTKSEGSERQIAELAKTTAKASLLRAKSALNNAKERLDWTTIIAPMAGRVVQCDVEEGEIITSGRSAWSQGPAIMIIADLSKMIVKAYVHEFDIGKVKVGQRAEIEISAYPDDVFEGEVKEISPSGQPMDNIIKFEVMVMVTKAPKPLLPAMTADVDIIVDERDNVPQLPLEAVIPREAIQIKTDIKKEMLSKLRDQEVKIAISNYPDKTFDGKVTEIAQARPGFTTSEVTIIMKGSPKELQTGTSRTADIIISDDEKISNAQTRIETEKKYYVKLIKEETGEVTENPGDKEKKKDKGKEEKTEEEKMVKVGERTQSNIEILDGLKEGDKVKVVPVGGEKKKEE